MERVNNANDKRRPGAARTRGRTLRARFVNDRPMLGENSLVTWSPGNRWPDFPIRFALLAQFNKRVDSLIHHSSRTYRPDYNLKARETPTSSLAAGLIMQFTLYMENMHF